MDDARPKDLVGWNTAFSSVAHYPVLSWLGFIQNPTETDLIVHTPCVYCKKKVKIPAEAPLLQAERKCGVKRRNSIATEWNAWRAYSAEIVVEPSSLPWVPEPESPFDVAPDIRKAPPPCIAPPLLNSLESSVRKHRNAVAKRWSRSDDASFPLISFNWADNLSPPLTSCAQKYLDSVDVECSVGNLVSLANLGGNLNRLAGEVRISPRHIQCIALGKRADFVKGLGAVSYVDPELVEQVKGFHTR